MVNSPKPTADLFVVGGTALTMDLNNTVIEDVVISINGSQIVSLKSEPGFSPPPGSKIISAKGCLVLPGLINGHTHSAMSLLRGIADDLPLEEWLNNVIFPLERKWGSSEFVYLGSLLSTLEMIQSGTTTFNDMYYYEEAVALATKESGMRSLCGQTVVEIGHVQDSISNLVDVFDRYLSTISGIELVTPTIAPHSVYGVSRPVMEKILEVASRKKLPIHIHLSETEKENQDCLKRFGKTPTQYLEEMGYFSHRVIAAHAIFLSPEDIGILGKHRVGISHNPESNLKIGSSICPIKELRGSGAEIALGTDGVASNNNLDLLGEVDFAAKLQALKTGVGSIKSLNFVRILTIEGAGALGLSNTIGSLEPGKAADLIALDLNNAHSVPLYDVYSHIVYAACGADTKHSIINGKVVMEDRKVKTLDEEAILKESLNWGKRIKKSLT